MIIINTKWGPNCNMCIDIYFSSTFGKPILLTIVMKVASNCVRVSVKDKWPSFPRTLGQALILRVCVCVCVCVCNCFLKAWQGILIISSFWGLPTASHTAPLSELLLFCHEAFYGQDVTSFPRFVSARMWMMLFQQYTAAWTPRCWLT